MWACVAWFPPRGEKQSACQPVWEYGGPPKAINLQTISMRVSPRASASRTTVPNFGVRGRGEATIADVLGVKALRDEPTCKGRRQLRVDQESHQATRNTG
jgi:hypothetical protein